MTRPSRETGTLADVRALVDTTDQAVFDAVADASTPHLDRLLVSLSNAANYSRLWMLSAAALATLGGAPGRRAACQGLLAVAVTSAMTNLVFKSVARRPRPPLSHRHPVPDSRRVRRPASTSFPSGHAASAFAFASAVGQADPPLRLPAHAAAAMVAYSRVHTGVHYPSDVATGAVVGGLCGRAVSRLARRWTGDDRHGMRG